MPDFCLSRAAGNFRFLSGNTEGQRIFLSDMTVLSGIGFQPASEKLYRSFMRFFLSLEKAGLSLLNFHEKGYIMALKLIFNS